MYIYGVVVVAHYNANYIQRFDISTLFHITQIIEISNISKFHRKLTKLRNKSAIYEKKKNI